MSPQVPGSDLSHWQTPSVALVDRLVSLGVRFAWVKTSDGRGLKDVALGSHHARLGARGIARGPYHFYRSAHGPEANAANFLAAMAGKTWELPPALDYEDQSGQARAADLIRFLEIVEEKTGRRPVIYTGPSWWRSTVSPLAAFGAYLLWLAKYPSRFTDGHLPAPADWPSAPAPWPRVGVWQYSSTGGTLDRNVTDEATFATLTRSTPPPTHPEEDVLNMAEITETQLREIIREETNDIRGGIMVSVDEGRTHYGSLRGWVVAVGLVLIGVEKPKGLNALRDLAHKNDPVASSKKD